MLDKSNFHSSVNNNTTIVHFDFAGPLEARQSGSNFKSLLILESSFIINIILSVTLLEIKWAGLVPPLAAMAIND